MPFPNERTKHPGSEEYDANALEEQLRRVSLLATPGADLHNIPLAPQLPSPRTYIPDAEELRKPIGLATVIPEHLQHRRVDWGEIAVIMDGFVRLYEETENGSDGGWLEEEEGGQEKEEEKQDNEKSITRESREATQVRDSERYSWMVPGLPGGKDNDIDIWITESRAKKKPAAGKKASPLTTEITQNKGGTSVDTVAARITGDQENTNDEDTEDPLDWMPPPIPTTPQRIAGTSGGERFKEIRCAPMQRGSSPSMQGSISINQYRAVVDAFQNSEMLGSKGKKQKLQTTRKQPRKVGSKVLETTRTEKNFSKEKAPNDKNEESIQQRQTKDIATQTGSIGNGNRITVGQPSSTGRITERTRIIITVPPLTPRPDDPSEATTQALPGLASPVELGLEPYKPHPGEDPDVIYSEESLRMAIIFARLREGLDSIQRNAEAEFNLAAIDTGINADQKLQPQTGPSLVFSSGPPKAIPPRRPKSPSKTIPRPASPQYIPSPSLPTRPSYQDRGTSPTPPQRKYPYEFTMYQKLQSLPTGFFRGPGKKTSVELVRSPKDRTIVEAFSGKPHLKSYYHPMFQCWLPFPQEVPDEVEQAAPGTREMIRGKMERLLARMAGRKMIKKEDISKPVLQKHAYR